MFDSPKELRLFEVRSRLCRFYFRKLQLDKQFFGSYRTVYVEKQAVDPASGTMLLPITMFGLRVK